MQTEIKILEPRHTGEFISLLLIFTDVFELDKPALPGEEYLAGLLNRKDFLVFAATSGSIVTGGLTVHILPSYFSTKPVAYIYDVAVRQDQQRKGTGSKLIAAAVAYCRANGFEEAYVEAETDDIQAVNFYRKTNHTKTVHAVQFTYCTT